MTYDELQALLRAQTDENPSVQQLTTFIRFAEGWFDDTLRCRDMESSETIPVTVTGNEATAPLPADFNEARQVSSTQNPPRVLQATTPDEIVTLSPLKGSSDPVAYAIIGQNMRIAPTGLTAISLLYYAKVPKLSVSVQTNWLIARRPDLYYYRSLYEMAAYMNQGEKASVYQGLCNQIVQEIEAHDKTIYHNASVRMRVPVA